jgi:hypothetical protein
MLDRGYGAVGVAINSAPTVGVPMAPLSQLKIFNRRFWTRPPAQADDRDRVGTRDGSAM